jgi:hypothetical protein
MLRRSFFKAASVALAVLAAAYVPGKPWEAIENSGIEADQPDERLVMFWDPVNCGFAGMMVDVNDPSRRT